MSAISPRQVGWQKWLAQKQPPVARVISFRLRHLVDLLALDCERSRRRGYD
jgi:hypothetical protein